MKNLNLYLIGLFSIIFVQQGNSQWTSLGTGIDATPRQVFSISVPDSNTVWAITWDNVNDAQTFEFTRTTDGGQVWQTGIMNIDASQYAGQIYALDDTTAWVCTTNFTTGFIYKTLDGGMTWIKQTTLFNTATEIPVGIHFFNEDSGVAFGAPGQDIYDNQIKIYYTMNGGIDWTKIPTSELPTQLSGEGITDELGNGVFSAVGNSIWFPTSMNRVFRSQDMGLTWQVFDTGMTGEFSYADATSIAMKDSLNGIIISNTGNEAVRTIDGGESWVSITMNLPSQGIEEWGQINYIPGTPGTYLVHDTWFRDDTKVYLTVDDGDNWEVIEACENISCSVFLSPTIGYAGGDIVGPENGGIYKWTGDECPVSVKPVVDSGKGIKLFPNPTSDFISFQIPEMGNQSLNVSIFDAQGKLVLQQKVIANEWIGVQNLAPGFYTLKTVFDDTIYTGKFIKN